jgi:uncharacterized protein (DUF983 family)
MSEKKRKPLYLWSTLTNRCPRCREGKLFITDNPYDFKNNVKMHEQCPVCGQPTEIEVGFYYGTGFVSYGLTVAFSGITFVAWWFLIGFSLYDNRLFYWLGINAVAMLALQPVFMRLSRSLWLSWFVRYDPDWKIHKAQEYERIVKEQMNNW